MDTSKPNIARVYDYWLGGKDNHAADRDVADRMLEHDPGLRDRVRDNREFVTGVARLAAERGIAQFIDLGAGLPTRPSVHEAARAVHPGARVAVRGQRPGGGQSRPGAAGHRGRARVAPGGPAGPAGQAVRAAHDGTVPEPRHRAAGRVPGRA